MIVLLVLLALVPNYSQTLSIYISNANEKKASIYQISGEKTTLLDSNVAISKGSINYTFQRNDLPDGQLSVFLSPRLRVDFLYDGRDVVLETDAKALVDSMKVKKSESNRLFYSFLKLNRDYKTKTELLHLILARYPKYDPYYTETRKRLNELQSNYIEFVNVTSQENPDLFVSRYIRSSQLPILDSDLSVDGQLPYLKAHALDNVDFNNKRLINSDVFANKAIEYLSYYRNPQLPKELLEKEFCSAIDSVLSKARTNSFVYEHITEYLIGGFKRFGFDTVLDYLVNNYVIKDDLCLDVKTEGMIKRRIDHAKYIKIGSTAPDFKLLDHNGNEVELHKLKQVTTLLVFYTTQCPHCRDIMPKLNTLYKSFASNDFKIIAVCLESKKDVWEQFVKEFSPDLINVSDLKGWDGQIAADYCLYATPTMIAIDNEKKIIGKPLTFEEASRILN